MKKILICVLVLILLAGCTQQSKVNKNDLIMNEKVTPEDDNHPLILHSNEFEEPTPLPYPVNTAGGEDSPFILPSGETLYFFFTPNVSKPAQEQLLDGVTGIWKTEKEGNNWTELERIRLIEHGKLSLDGCPFVQDDVIWFCSVREEYEGMNWFKYENESTALINFPEEYEVGELHVNNNWTRIYYHSTKQGGEGGLDLWMSDWNGTSWSEPVNLRSLNTNTAEGWPFLTEDEQELWFLREYNGTPAVYKSDWNGTSWEESELIISGFAGEPSLDAEGNLYLVHHYYENNTMLESDIYVARRK